MSTTSGLRVSLNWCIFSREVHEMSSPFRLRGQHIGGFDNRKGCLLLCSDGHARGPSLLPAIMFRKLRHNLTHPYPVRVYDSMELLRERVHDDDVLGLISM
jgi:hypothetical protein